ncbi:hypothetical protein AYI68_g2065 [Smittium mucronatum]|uniref:Uncharacterized protein n=1 Tax=Smittium mucronatum TaxID=133383 RepID=A0A1R0H3T3_9FUNG|nr:hypothetical protein AYI68_g2065 [Smittium mucronatum]
MNTFESFLVSAVDGSLDSSLDFSGGTAGETPTRNLANALVDLWFPSSAASPQHHLPYSCAFWALYVPSSHGSNILCIRNIAKIIHMPQPMQFIPIKCKVSFKTQP